MQTTTFNPIDMIIELGTPVGTVLFTYQFISKCKPSVAVSSFALALWYISDHDETRESHHTKHHLACNGQYAAYVPIDLGAEKELVRGLLKKNERKEKLLALQSYEE